MQANREGKGNQARQTGFGRVVLHVRPARQGKHLGQLSIATQRMQSRKSWPTGQGRAGQGRVGRGRAGRRRLGRAGQAGQNKEV